MAYSNDLDGDWILHEPNVLTLRNSLFAIKAPAAHHMHPSARQAIAADLDGDYPHIASPDAHVIESERKIFMYFHGRNPDGTQQSRLAISDDGLEFKVRPYLLGDSYFRVFGLNGTVYALALRGRLYRSTDFGYSFEPGPFVTQDAFRHCALLAHEDRLWVIWSRAGDCPESLLISELMHTCDGMSLDWKDWQLGKTQRLHRALRAWEGSDLTAKPSRFGGINIPVNQLRDPAVFVEKGTIRLLYSVKGEQGIAMVELLCV